jgi:AraC-like DNA-binding protein
MDRDFASPLDVPTVARHALMSPAHFSRQFKAAYGETPYDYLISRRIERAMLLLRAGSTVTEACHAVGYTSLGSFSERFTALMGESPSSYRSHDHSQLKELLPCLLRAVSRPAPRNSQQRNVEQDSRSAVTSPSPIVEP